MEKASPTLPLAQAYRLQKSYPAHPTRGTIVICFTFLAVWLVLAVRGLLSATTGSSSLDAVRPSNVPPNVTQIGDVHWWPTDDPDIVDGQIMIPVDYTNYTKGSMILGLRKLPANCRKDEKKGTVLLNSGGPGGDASRWTFEGMKGIAIARVGPHYDIVGFSPRGVGRSIPRVECFKEPGALSKFVANTPLQNSIDLHPNPGSLAAREDVMRAMVQIDAMHEVQGKMCAENMDVDMLRYMGTTYVARDVDFLTTVLEGKDSLINYWSGSYGSVLGAYVLNMFPKRIGRVSIDGIVDAKLWADESADFAFTHFLPSTDDAFARFVRDCVEAGPDACPLLRFGDTTVQQLTDRIDHFLDNLYYHPLAVANDERPGVLTSGAARSAIALALEVPSRWSLFADSIAEAMSGNGAALYRIVSHSGEGDMARQAVVCADTPPISRDNRTEWPTAGQMTDLALRALEGMSRRWALAYLAQEPSGGCAFWPTNKREDESDGKAVERFTGPWNNTLSNPVLITSAKDDPITPLVNAQSLHKRLSNSSVLLVQDSAGHSTVLSASLCTAYHSVRYFNTGVLPPPDTVCSLDVTPFGNSEVDRRPKSAQEQNILKGVDDILGASFGRMFDRA